uniref:Pre-mRNA cleavage factor Im 25 kDa subunit n=1 Tax=Aegilops tauschii subsp. strangulata TaxID=200361 RepID=A0A453S4X4_AEGTS
GSGPASMASCWSSSRVTPTCCSCKSGTPPSCSRAAASGLPSKVRTSRSLKHASILAHKKCCMFWGNKLFNCASDVQGLKRKLSSKLAAADRNGDHHWQIGECIGMWWRSEFEARPFPYPPPNTRAPKECVKLFLVRLPMARQFVVPRNLKLLAVPLSQIHDNPQVYGPIISGVPNLLSKFSFNLVRD